MGDYEQGRQIFKNFLIRSAERNPNDPYIDTLTANPTYGLNRYVKTAITKCKKIAQDSTNKTDAQTAYQTAYQSVKKLIRKYNGDISEEEIRLIFQAYQGHKKLAVQTI